MIIIQYIHHEMQLWVLFLFLFFFLLIAINKINTRIYTQDSDVIRV